MYKVRLIESENSVFLKAKSIEEAKEIARSSNLKSVIYTPKNTPILVYCPEQNFFTIQ